jgi:hypothetical protein
VGLLGSSNSEKVQCSAAVALAKLAADGSRSEI